MDPFLRWAPPRCCVSTSRSRWAEPAQLEPLESRRRAPPPTDNFSSLLDGLVSNVTSKATAADSVTRQVLMGNSDQLHQSVIAMQEAGVAFSMMIEVRNKLVDSYQELMRMQV